MAELLHLLLGTIALRPYVFLFLLVYAVAATAHLGWRRTVVFLPLGYGIAWFSEFLSIHWGFPYGYYYYIPHTVGQELWVAGVPFMDSLSYVFLAYCSYATALFLLSPLLIRKDNLFILETRPLRRSWRILLLGAVLFVFLDIIIDPVALQGHLWFLGQIYGYRVKGLYFGIPMSNFGGWLVVGLAMVGCLQLLDRLSSLEPHKQPPFSWIPYIALLGPILYVSVLVFNLSITFWIGETLLGLVGLMLFFFPSLLTLYFTLYKQEHFRAELIDLHLNDFPPWRAAQLGLFACKEMALHQQFLHAGGRKTQKSA